MQTGVLKLYTCHAADQALEEGCGKLIDDSAHGKAPSLKDKEPAQAVVPGDLASRQ